MRITSVAVLDCCIIFLSIRQILTLKCRTGTSKQQNDEQFQSIMHSCRRRNHEYHEDNLHENNNQETNSQEIFGSSSDENTFENIFLSSGGNRYKNKKNESEYKNHYSRSLPLLRNKSSQYLHHNWSRRHYLLNDMNGTRYSYEFNRSNSNKKSRRNRGMDFHGYIANNYYVNKNADNIHNINYNNNKREWKQICIIQCFFYELNLVDQRGFPEKSAVITLMTQNIQDLELRDFIEESIIECYHYLNTSNKQDNNCQFSQNLFTCLTDKCSEVCEDWNEY